MDSSTLLTLNEGVFVVPVADLPDDVRARLDPADGEFALTRPQGRNGSKLLGKEAADLVERFREPHSLIEAVILHSRLRGAQPEAVLEDALPLVRSLLTTGYLVPLGDDEQAPAAGGVLATGWKPGDTALGGRIERVLQVLDDTELYLLRRDGEPARVLKVARRAGEREPVHGMLRREAAILEGLGGDPSPALYAHGELDGRPYLEMEHVAGVDLETEAAARRRDPAGARGAALALLTAVADAYARLHERGLVHGDVHPRNLLVERDGTVRLIDFGLAREAGEGGDGKPEPPRGGVPFFWEPELARTFLDGEEPPAATEAGERYALGVLGFLVAAGAPPRDYSLGREEMLAEIVERPPLPFTERGTEPWPELEAVLGRALAKDPAERFGSTAELAAALRAVAVPPPTHAPARQDGDAAEALVRRCLDAADVGGDWLTRKALTAPSASVNYGAAGVALGLLAIAGRRTDARALTLAGIWLGRARRGASEPTAFYNPEIEITRETVGESSPYHSEAGIHAVAALLARARGDVGAQAEATAAFVAASERPAQGLDLTLGRAATLLGAAILLDAAPDGLDEAVGTGGENPGPVAALRDLGGRRLDEIWTRLEPQPPIPEADVEYLGIAHGWAGFLYATLAWCEAAGAEVPPGLERRWAELADLAVPDGRGLTWPWTLHGEGRGSTMPGWCNGSAGYVFLWTRAHARSSDPRHLDLAVGAAWDAWDAPDPATSLCCGLAGRGYALLALHRATGDRVWLDRARALAARGGRHGMPSSDDAHSLYKGELGLATLVADLDRPEEARMPLFEPTGYRTAG